MYNEESLETRQDNEFEVLTAIFGEDLRDLRKKTAWNRWQPLNFTVALKPQQGSSRNHEIHVQTNLHVKCSPNYPNEEPQISLENTKGLSNAVILKLQEELKEKARSLRGEEMVFQLAQYVQEFLHIHNKPGCKSFYDEMLKRQKQEEQLHEEAAKLAKDKEKRVNFEEMLQRQEMLKSESKLRRENRYNSESTENDDSSPNDVFSEESVCFHSGTKVVMFTNNGNREVERGKCIYHSNHHTVFIGLDKNSGEIVALSEWIINPKNNAEFLSAQKHISSIEQELNYLVKLKHRNLAHYLSIKHEQIPQENKIVVETLRNFVIGSSCSSFFTNKNMYIEYDLLRHLLQGVLSAVDYLHRNNVVHKDIKDSCVYVSDKGIIKVSNYSISKRLSDLVCHQIYNNNNKKTDIFQIGTLVLSLFRGKRITETNVDIPKTVPSILHDFLEKCLHKEEKHRHTATQLLNHPFLKAPIENFPHRIKELEEDSISNFIDTSKNNSDPKILSGLSRVKNEFEFLQHLGKGAYGDVIKVRNNLDGRFYAIKRIELSPKDKQLKKKILREVKLLSRLNHENVVRYYNSWIETALVDDDTDVSDNTTSFENVPKVIVQKELTFEDDIEALAPPIRNVVDWRATSDTTKSFSALHSSSSSESDSDDDCMWIVNQNGSDSDDVQFERDEIDGSVTGSSTETSKRGSESSITKKTRQVQFMYIQMEFCEKSTLRIAIDNNLYLEEDRLWRLFREIVEGLVHIHQQGMIHRDLKPVNIFLDSNDHVKIGDFGLATTSMKLKQSEYYMTSKSLVESEKEDGSMTGQVGTALYVAPEISSTQKASYNQKVDIYSLGIILFEMCYKPLNTGMERIKVLQRLRTKEISFPADFKRPENDKKEFLIKWLLNHDSTLRPTSQELLMSDYVPPPVLEECELREFMRHTLSNPQLKAYKYLVASCFKQTLTPAQDITYDKDPIAPTLNKPLQLYESVKEKILKVFKLHGGLNLATPLLMPKSKYYQNFDTCVNLMTHSGNIVSLPHDLRVPFARYVAWNGITSMRRFSIERVYREKKVFGFVPRELYECSFDIVSSTKENFMPDAEILYIVCEIIDNLCGLKNKNFTIRLNHTSLIKGILLHYGIKENHDEVYRMLSDEREGKIPKNQLLTYFIRYGLSDSMISTLMNLLSIECDYTKASSYLKVITKRSGEASQLAKQALQELKTIIHKADCLGVQFDVIISPGMVYNMRQYSGMICQVVCELKKKHRKNCMDVVAAGGRYDNMISEYRSVMERANIECKDVQQSAVGISISLDKLVQALQEENKLEVNRIPFLDAVVCALGSKPLSDEKLKILRILWSSGIRSCAIEANNIEEIQQQCKDLKVSHAIILKDNELNSIKIRSWDKERFQEKSFRLSELAENMQRLIKTWYDNGQDFGINSCPLIRSENRSLSVETYHEANAAIVYLTNEKQSSISRKRYDNQIRFQLDNTLKRLNGEVVIFGLDIESSVLKTVAVYLAADATEQEFYKSVDEIIDKHQRHRKYLNEVCSEIRECKMRRTSPIVILYSLKDSQFALLVQ